MLYKLGEAVPELVGDGHFIAPNAVAAGAVKIYSRVSLWFNAVLRADVEYIEIGEDTNFQDCAVGHTDPGFPLTLGRGITVGHGAILHGCSIGDHSLVGMNAVVLNGAKVGRHCLIGANSLVPQGTVIPDNSLFIGSPGKVIRTIPEKAKEKIMENGQFYLNLTLRYNKEGEIIKELDS